MLTRQDLILAMAWKIGGLIDHNSSESKKDIVFLQSWPSTLKASGQFRVTDYSRGIPYLDANMDTIVNEINQGNPKYLFDLGSKLEGIGKVYVLTILFFITHGKFPIYDKYAHIAAQAIYDGLPPGSLIEYKAIKSWSDYLDYMKLLSDIRNNETESQDQSTMFITRQVDRSLWVYGHFFIERNNAVVAAVTREARAPLLHENVTEMPHQEPTNCNSDDNILVGTIRDLSNVSGQWRRREIIVKQQNDGYPEVRSAIVLIDTGKSRYSLQFIKGANKAGYTCLVKPGTLMPWFIKHYSIDKVDEENVYFRPTGIKNEYLLYTEKEWKAHNSEKYD